MNTEYLLDAIGLLDDDLIQEAEAYQVPHRRPHYRAWTALAACFAVVIVLGYGLTHLNMDSKFAASNNSGAAQESRPAASGACSALDENSSPSDNEMSGGGEFVPDTEDPEAPAGSPEEDDYCAAIMVDGVLYWSTGTPIPAEVDESAIQTVTAYINTVPQMDGQTNFSQDLSAQYAMTDQGLVVRIDREWVLFDPVPPWERGT